MKPQQCDETRLRWDRHWFVCGHIHHAYTSYTFRMRWRVRMISHLSQFINVYHAWTWNNLGTTCQGPHTIGTYASVACASSTCGWWACPGAKCSAGSLDSRHISKRLCRESNVFCFFYYCNLQYLLLLFNLFESCSLILRIGFRRHMYADFFLRFVDAVSREVSDAWPKRSAAYCVLPKCLLLVVAVSSRIRKHESHIGAFEDVEDEVRDFQLVPSWKALTWYLDVSSWSFHVFPM